MINRREAFETGERLEDPGVASAWAGIEGSSTMKDLETNCTTLMIRGNDGFGEARHSPPALVDVEDRERF